MCCLHRLDCTAKSTFGAISAYLKVCVCVCAGDEDDGGCHPDEDGSTPEKDASKLTEKRKGTDDGGDGDGGSDDSTGAPCALVLF